MPAPSPKPPRGAGLWLGVMVLLILAGIIVPYGLLGGSEPGLGIAAFWLVFGLAVAGMILAGVARWRDKP
ncbi:hypothetical protein [Alkalilacustris brevis]|uniref:hypothetical protein n=1 Tax=Alkalilacustris brevis TaxID=2026338 RepID=UPI000E0D2EAB|nr:hypothetical protein [Alkalilacustris brevis]